jgi:uncharacterized DUF497 family protein
MYENMYQFDWDERKNRENQHKHNVSFNEAQNAFLDENRVITYDEKHSTPEEKRYFCFGIVKGMVLTVRFTVRNNIIRIFGAGYWREGRKKYEEENEV